MKRSCDMRGESMAPTSTAVGFVGARRNDGGELSGENSHRVAYKTDRSIYLYLLKIR